MKDTPLTEAVKELIKFDLEILDEVIKEDADALADIGNPEKLIGKKYEDWTLQDKQMLGTVYGTQEPNTLSEFIFKKEYKAVLEIEEEVQ